MLVCFGYILGNAPAVVAASLGSHALDEVGTLGSLFGTVGAVLRSYGMTGAAVSAWLCERRDLKAFKPLWQLAVLNVDERFALDPSGCGRRVNVRFTLHRWVVEILDGMRVLRAWSSAEAAETIRRHVHASPLPLSAAERQAVITAAVLRDAHLRLQAARGADGSSRPAPPLPPDATFLALPGEDTAASDERARLLLVAAHLNHPLTDSSLAELRTTSPSTAGRPPASAR
ncbi:DUF6545 domain-containing protein [Streptomyces sp. NPDC058084]|uniref:DUF6545 domain-containing protein n=1 Tax=Streptomyces sp. NPDC058084 TaxID=3346333 RepID=UPI0036EDD8E7